MTIHSLKVQLIWLLLLIIVGQFNVFAGPNDTDDFYLCAHKVEGSWGQFGRIPKACDINPFGSPEFVIAKMLVSIFDDNVDRTAETSRYMDQMNAIIKASAEYYLTTRKPTVSAEEITAWKQAILSVATVESYWSHYRLASDSRLKMIRGDSGHGHGMMQIDDRWHFTAIEDGVGWQLFENMLYSFEIYFAAWQDAVGQSCLNDATNWRDRSRSAYSAYNGGPTKLCRWQDNPGEWVQDTNFANLYDDKPWIAKINNPELNSALDVICFLEGEVDCLPMENNSVEASWDYQLLSLVPSATGDARECLFYGGSFHCVDQAQDIICVSVLLDYVARETSLTVLQSDSEFYSVTDYERHACLANTESSFKVTDTLRSIQSITIRTTPGGATTGKATQLNRYYQILDIVVSGQQDSQYRYYKINADGTEGYIYAGDKDNYFEWATLAEHADLIDVIIPIESDKIKIIAANGLLLRQSIESDSEILKTIPKDTEVIIEETVVVNSDNAIYYKINYETVEGWSYGGHLIPESTLEDWATIVKSSPPIPPVTPPPTSNSKGGGGSTELLSILLLSLLLTRYKSHI